MAKQPDPPIDPARALRQLTDWAQKRAGYIQIIFRGPDPLHQPVNGVPVPHPWQCLAHNNQGRTFSALGVTMDEAITECYRQWRGW